MPKWLDYLIDVQDSCRKCRPKGWAWPKNPIRVPEIRYSDPPILYDLDADSYEALMYLRIEWMCRPVSCGRQPFLKAVD